ncbi:MAG: cation transporter [Chitinivibrionia bacterium]|nr:cation transporter [Chitinivibrionia bacterium]
MRIKPALLPPLVVVLFFAAIVAGRGWELPTMQHQFSSSSHSKQVTMIVDGLRCRGTSDFFVKRLETVPGLVSVGTFVQEHRAEIAYDPDAITVQRIREIIEAPLQLEDGRMVQPFKVQDVRE